MYPRKAEWTDWVKFRGTGQAAWDSTGSAKGLYLAVVELTDAQGHVTRQVLKLVVQ